ncbi:hypothetical protein V8E53_015590 [Lactarius tabidus]
MTKSGLALTRADFFIFTEGHYSNSPRCKLPKGAIKCYRCGGNHDGRDHDYECNARTHKTVGKCDCALKCLLCKKVSHNARSRSCLKRGDFQPPRLPDTDKHVTRTDNFIPVSRRKQGGKRNQNRKNQPTARIDDEDEPFRGHFTVPESQTIPLPMCPTEVGKNVLLCMCCTLPLVAEYRKRFVTPYTEVRDESTMPTAQIISSKGQSMMGLYSELRTRKAYGTALLANNNNIAEAIRNSADLHEEDEIKRLLDEADEEVQQEIEVEHELNMHSQEWGTHINDETLPSPHFGFEGMSIDPRRPAQAPILVEVAILNNITDEARIRGDIMGWDGPSATTGHNA